MKKFLLLGILMLSFSSCRFFDILVPGTEVSRTDTGSINAAGVTTLSINISAKITIVPVSGNNINYNITKKVQAGSVVEGDKALDQMAFQKSLSGADQTISMNTPVIDHWNIYSVSAEGTIKIPSNIKILRCNVSSGSMDIDGGGVFFTAMDLKVSSGQLNVRNFSITNNGTFSGTTTSGKIGIDGGTMAQNSAFSINATSGKADINVSSFYGCSVTGKVTSGSLDFSSSMITNSAINLEITSGYLHMDTLSLPGSGTAISLKDTSGSIRFSTLPANSANYDLQATSGNVSVDSKYNPPYENGNLNFSRNGGLNSIKIRCTSGSIHLD